MGPGYRRVRLLALALVCSGFLVTRIHRAQSGHDGDWPLVVQAGQETLQVTVPLELARRPTLPRPDSKYPFQHYDAERPPQFKLTDGSDVSAYFKDVSNITCFSLGTDFSNTTGDICTCLKGWTATDCSLPDSVSSSKRFRRRWTNKKIRRRVGPARRVINALNFNHELDLLEIRLHELYSVVDVFIVCESNYSALGEPKPLRLLPQLMKGFLAEYQDKIVHVVLNHFPDKGREDGWYADGYQRTFLWKHGRQRISGLRDDDLFVLTDADEIPRAGALAFLKTHEGYGEPMFLRLRWSLYGFFWLHMQEHVQVLSVCTVRFLSKVLKDDASRLRREEIPPEAEDVYGGALEEWVLGQNSVSNAGWHCSWCFDTEGLRIKLRSAQKDDGIRWGDFPEKTTNRYLRVLVKRGLWFDGKKVSKAGALERGVTVPAHVMDNPKFRYLLEAASSTTS
ncbi:unnamed protein product [Ixodes hexagonus]